MDVRACIGLPLLSQATRGRYCTAVFAAPADLGDLMAYTTYAARIAKCGASMARFGVNLERWQVEIVFSMLGEQCRPPSIFNPPHNLANIKSSLIDG